MSGITELHVRIVSGRNLKDTQTFGTQDPFCEVSCGNRTFSTHVHDNGGLNPAWNEKFVFTIYDSQMEQLHIVCKNKNFTESKIIGECRLQVNLFRHGNIVDQWFTLNKGSKRTGDLNLRVQMVGEQVGQAVATGMHQVIQKQSYAPSAPPTSGNPLGQTMQAVRTGAHAAYPGFSSTSVADPTIAHQQSMIQQQQAQLRMQQAQLKQQQLDMELQQQEIQQQAHNAVSHPVHYVQPPQQPVYVQAPPPPRPVVVHQPAVYGGGYGGGYHQNRGMYSNNMYGGRSRGSGGFGGVAGAAGLGVVGGLLLGSALGDDGGFDFD